MITARADILGTEGQAGDAAEMQHERWHHWPVNWTAVWVGTLTALAVALMQFGPLHLSRIIDGVPQRVNLSLGWQMLFGTTAAFGVCCAGRRKQARGA